MILKTSLKTEAVILTCIKKIGDVVFDELSLIETIIHYTHDGYKMKSKFADYKHNILSDLDLNNYQRIYEEAVALATRESN